MKLGAGIRCSRLPPNAQCGEGIVDIVCTIIMLREGRPRKCRNEDRSPTSQYPGALALGIKESMLA